MKIGYSILGIFSIITSLIGMLGLHEFAISGIAFIFGIILIGIGYRKLHLAEGWAINTKQINENLQNFNNVLWGEEKKSQREPEPQIKIIIVQKK